MVKSKVIICLEALALMEAASFCEERNKRYSAQQESAPKTNIIKIKNLPEGRRDIKKKMASDLHRTATTTYLCYVPILEDSAGAGRVGLAVANIQSFCIFANEILLYIA